ncbi:MAG: PEP-CTERM sorting domain-containing protein [Pirellulales bacterium]
MRLPAVSTAKELVLLGCGSLALLLLVSSPADAQRSGWEVLYVNVDDPINDQTTAEAILNAKGVGYTNPVVATKTYPVVDFVGSTGGQQFPYNFAYPDGSTNAGNDFAIRATSTVTIPAGTWSVGFASDDGGQLTLPSGLTFASTFGENPTNGQGAGTSTIRYEGNRGHAWTGGSFTAAAPVTGTMVGSFHERGGGDSFEIGVAQGARSGFSGSWRPLGDGVFGWSVKTSSNAASGGDAVIEIAGNDVGKLHASGTVSSVVRNSGTAIGGLTHRYFSFPNQGDFAAANELANGSLPVSMFSPGDARPQWWGGSEGAKPGGVSGYQDQLVADIGTGKFPGQNASNLDNYLAVLTGQILIPGNGPIRFKDGVDDFSSLRIDVNGNGTFEASEQLINDNASTSYAGTSNSGSPIVQADFSGIPAGGQWVNIEFMTWEGGGADSGVLWWDALNPSGFPVDATSPPSDLTSFVPSSHLRTFGVEVTMNPALDPFAKYRFDVHSMSFVDQIAFPTGPDVVVKPLDLNGARLEVKNIGDLSGGYTIKIVDGPSVGWANFEFPAGTTWDMTNLNDTGQIKALWSVDPDPRFWPPNFDVDSDRDIDMSDLAAFLEAWTGSLGAGNLEVGDNPDLVYDPATGNDQQGLFGLPSQADVLWKRGAGDKGTLDVVVVPEPASLGLLGLGLMILVNVARRRSGRLRSP